MSFNSYAQNFEDVMLWRALGHVPNGFYIDVGAQHPIVDSVSLAFHEHGWHGIHVEPLPQYAELLREQRPGDTILQAAVAPTSEVLQFYEIPNSGISTADAEIATSHRARGFEIREIFVPCVTLTAVFDLCKGKDIHWLKIDVEGYEAKVLTSWGKSRARPWIVVVESTLPLSQVQTHEQWEAMLLRLGYESAYFDGLNRYYIAAAHPELKAAFASPPNVFDGFTLNGTASAPFQGLLERRHHEQLEGSRAGYESRLESAGTATQEAVERFALLELAHREAVSQLEQAHVQRVGQMEQAHRESLTLLGQQHAAQVGELREREARLAEQAGALQTQVETLVHEQAQRERESARTLLESQQRAETERTALTREWADLTRTQLAQSEERQRQHAEREDSLMRQLHSTREDRRAAGAEISRLQASMETAARDATDRVEAIYQRASLEREQVMQTHEHRMSQVQRDHAEQKSAAELHAQRLLARADEHRMRAETLEQELSTMTARLVAEQQSAHRLQQELAIARREIEDTQRTISWRLTRPLRYLATTLAHGK